MKRGSPGRPVARALAALLLLALSAVPATAQTTPVAFTHVNLLRMDRERILEDHTVVVRDGVIQAWGPSERVEVPGTASVIDGKGLFLMPALGDMYVHLPGAGATGQEVEDFLFLCLANNVTVVRGMHGVPAHLQMKRRVATGALTGPTIYVGSPTLEGSSLTDSATAVPTAINRMLAYRSAGYDFLQTGRSIPPIPWDSLAEEAHSRGYTFGGLIPDSVGLRYALGTGISTVDHLDGYLEWIVPEDLRHRMDEGERVPLRTLLEAAEGRRMRAMAAHTRSSDTWVVPTLHLWETTYRPLDVDSLLALPRMAYVPSSTREYWRRQKEAAPTLDPETAELLVEVRRQLVRAITMSGAGVLAGSGAPRLFNVPGFALRDELASLEAANLTPYEVLVIATRSVAAYAARELRERGNFGIVAEGNRADLILLRANPFRELEALWDQEGVMVRGHWLSRETIEEGLAEIAERHGEDGSSAQIGEVDSG